MAFRTDLLRRSDVLERMVAVLLRDVPLHGVLQSLGLRLRVVPAATMVNGERISLRNSFIFIRRQMLSVRLLSPALALVLAAGVGSVTAMAVASGRPVGGPATGNGSRPGRWAVCWRWGGRLIAAMARIDGALRGMAARRGAALPWPSVWIGPRRDAHAVRHLTALLSAIRMRKVEWRGVTTSCSAP